MKRLMTLCMFYLKFKFSQYFSNAFTKISPDQFKFEIAPQATIEKLIKNQNFINDELQEAVDAWGKTR